MEFIERRVDGKRHFRIDGSTVLVENYDLTDGLLSRDTTDLTLLQAGPREFAYQHQHFHTLRRRAMLVSLGGLVAVSAMWALEAPRYVPIVVATVSSAASFALLWGARQFRPLVRAMGWRNRTGTHALDVVREPGNDEPFDAFVAAVDAAIQAAAPERTV